MFQDDETEVLAHLHCWFDRILSATPSSKLDQPLPILFAINKIDLVILNDNMNMDQFKNRIYDWLIAQLKDVLENNQNAVGCIAYNLLPKDQLIFFSAQNAWLGLSVRNGNCDENTVCGIMEYMWGRNLPLSTEQAVDQFGEAVNLVTTESNVDEFFHSTMDMVIQNISPVIHSVLQEIFGYIEVLSQSQDMEFGQLLEQYIALQSSFQLFKNK